MLERRLCQGAVSPPSEEELCVLEAWSNDQQPVIFYNFTDQFAIRSHALPAQLAFRPAEQYSSFTDRHLLRHLLPTGLGCTRG